MLWNVIIYVRKEPSIASPSIALQGLGVLQNIHNMSCMEIIQRFAATALAETFGLSQEEAEKLKREVTSFVSADETEKVSPGRMYKWRSTYPKMLRILPPTTLGVQLFAAASVCSVPAVIALADAAAMLSSRPFQLPPWVIETSKSVSFLIVQLELWDFGWVLFNLLSTLAPLSLASPT